MIRSFSMGVAWYLLTILSNDVVGAFLANRAWSSMTFLIFTITPQLLIGFLAGLATRTIANISWVTMLTTFLTVSMFERVFIRSYIIYDWDLMSLFTIAGDILLTVLAFFAAKDLYKFKVAR